MSNLVLQPVSVQTGSGDEEGQLVMFSGRLVGVLVHLTDPVQGALMGHWFLEAGFGPCSDSETLFENLEVARAWFLQRLGH